MGTGGSSSPLPPEIVINLGLRGIACSLYLKLAQGSSLVLFVKRTAPAGRAGSLCPCVLLTGPVRLRGFLSSPLRSSRISLSLRAALSLFHYSRPLAHPDNCTRKVFRVFPSLTLVSSESSPRPISIIKLVRYRTYTDDLSPDRLSGVLLACAMGIFILRWVSRLDAFSVYPVRTSLPCCALGRTTVAPVVRPFRSSRTRNSSSHDSSAHDG